jgi:LPS export ABC transporter protein LptC
MNLKTMFFVSLLGVFTLTVFIAFKSRAPSELKEASSSPSYIMNQVRSFRFTHTGRLESQLTAKTLVYSSNHRTTSFTEPSIQFFSNQKSKDPWTLHAHKGVLIHDTQKLKFLDNVILISPRDQTESSELLTDNMTLDYHQMTAYSSAPVVIKNHQFFLSGTGFHAKLKEAYIQISNDIKGQYQID